MSRLSWKYSEALKLQVLDAIKSGANYPSIAAKLGVDEDFVSFIARQNGYYVYQRPRIPCLAPNCNKSGSAKTSRRSNKGTIAGYCIKHARQIRKYGKLTPDREQKHLSVRTCQAPIFKVLAGKSIADKVVQNKHGQPITYITLGDAQLAAEKLTVLGLVVNIVPAAQCSGKHYSKGWCQRHYFQNYQAEKAQRSPNDNQ